MNKEELIKMLQEDLQNEYAHMMYYLQAASWVEGLHRPELREFFLKEAHEEMGHVGEFLDMIRYLGGTGEIVAPTVAVQIVTNPYGIIDRVAEMEQEVADNYAKRLRSTHEMENAAVATVHVFYEDQIKNSQMTAWEVSKWSGRFCHN
jgi:bacterioferritin